MNTIFLYYWIGLTIAYLIYYAVNIFNDLHAKDKEKSTSKSESIEVPQADNNEEPTEVVEDGDGFKITNGSQKNQIKDIQSAPNIPVADIRGNRTDNNDNSDATQTEVSDNTPPTIIDQENEMQLKIYEKLEEIQPTYSLPLDAHEIKRAIANSGKVPGCFIKIGVKYNEL